MVTWNLWRLIGSWILKTVKMYFTFILQFIWYYSFSTCLNFLFIYLLEIQMVSLESRSPRNTLCCSVHGNLVLDLKGKMIYIVNDLFQVSSVWGNLLYSRTLQVTMGNINDLYIWIAFAESLETFEPEERSEEPAGMSSTCYADLWSWYLCEISRLSSALHRYKRNSTHVLRWTG